MPIHPDTAYKEGSALPRFPRPIFLDTNVVQNLQSFGEFIYDNHLTSRLSSRISASGSRFADDIYALADFMALGRRAGWPIAVSSKTLDELEATPRDDKRFALANWGKELAHYFTSHSDDSSDEVETSTYQELSHFTFIQRRHLSALLSELPQESDRQLIIDALEYGCDIFLTMDYKTVWRYRDGVSRLGIKIMRPVELMEYIRPWAGLLR